MFYETSINERIGKANVIIFATNGSLTKDGRNVMGKGVGHLIASMVPTIPKIFGTKIKQSGNHCYVVKFMRYTFVSFPTKENYWESENTTTILRSLDELEALIPHLGDGEIVMEYPFLSKELHHTIINEINKIGGNRICLYLK